MTVCIVRLGGGEEENTSETNSRPDRLSLLIFDDEVSYKFFKAL